ncbi:MAG: hypothetical protein J6Z50_00410 [Fibrobacterales bacterium]|nr:hypothetical protein [Fibrobacterales bacterium]
MKRIPFRERIGVGVGLSAIAALFQVLAFCVNNLLAHVLGPGAFADYALLATDFSLFGAVAEFGTGVVILSFFAGRLRNPSVARAIFRLRRLLALLAAVLMSILVLALRAPEGLLLPGLFLALGFLVSPGIVDWYFLGTRDWKRLVRFKLIHAGTYVLVAAALFAVGFRSLAPVCLAISAVPLPAFLYARRFVPGGPGPLRPSQRRLIRLALKSAFPYALSGLASFAFLPAVLYAVNACWSGDGDRAAFTGAYKIVFVLQVFTLQFLTSEQIFSQRGLALSPAAKLRRCLLYGLASFGAVLPFAAAGQWIPRLLFFGLEWTPAMGATADWTMRVLLASIVLQFVRMPALAQFLADRRIGLSAGITVCAGAANLASLLFAARFRPGELALFGLAGDVLSTALMVCVYARTGRRAPGAGTLG